MKSDKQENEGKRMKRSRKPNLFSFFCLFRIEDGALNDQLNQVAEAIFVASQLGGQVVYVSVVTKGQWPAERIRRELVHHRSGKLILSIHQQVSLEPIDSSQRLSIEQF